MMKLVVAILLVSFINSNVVWIEMEDAFLSGYAGTTRRRHAYKTLAEAKTKCIETANCKGITKNNGLYEMRKGDTFKRSSSGETSWLMKNTNGSRWFNQKNA